MSVAIRKSEAVARPLKVLVPLIQNQLVQGERAGKEHYRQAGEMLIEAKSQIVYGNWGRWLSKNFRLDGRALSDITAQRYMRLARLAQADPTSFAREGSDYTAAVGDRRSRIEVNGAYRKVVNAARDLDAELFAQERQGIEEEVRLHRELAEEWNTIAYRVLAMRLHPDKKGGSKDAMARLNRIREVYTTFAKTRRFV